jgi:hypothetical protein
MEILFVAKTFGCSRGHMDIRLEYSSFCRSTLKIVRLCLLEGSLLI